MDGSRASQESFSFAELQFTTVNLVNDRIDEEAFLWLSCEVGWERVSFVYSLHKYRFLQIHKTTSNRSVARLTLFFVLEDVPFHYLCILESEQKWQSLSINLLSNGFGDRPKFTMKARIHIQINMCKYRYTNRQKNRISWAVENKRKIESRWSPSILSLGYNFFKDEISVRTPRLFSRVLKMVSEASSSKHRPNALYLRLREPSTFSSVVPLIHCYWRFSSKLDYYLMTRDLRRRMWCQVYGRSSIKPEPSFSGVVPSTRT